ncbi:MAG: threonylcarbamoyl-AMP synthase [Deltaproteobacteria bacterium]|nr:threonylcarbamoyl-AMP synthase [Deltaproteobacteria bacterium]
MFVEINPENPQLRLIEPVIKQMKSGAIICYPTDTGYGIGCDLFHPKAIKRLIQLKKRPKKKPFSFMCSDLTHISQYAHVSNSAYRLLKRNLPGAYTFVLPGTKLVPRIMASKQKTVGIRVPDHPICNLLIETLGNPIINTSVQLEEDDSSEGDNFSEALAIEEYLKNRVDIIIDGGRIFPDPSSIIDLTDDYPVVLREGKGDITPFL